MASVDCDHRWLQEQEEEQFYQAWRDTPKQSCIAHSTKDHIMPSINEMLQSKYLKKEDIDDEQLVTIQNIQKVNIAKENEKPQWKYAMTFEELAKPLLLNSTNIKLAAKACDSQDSDDWIGKKIVIYVDENITFGNDIVGGLRLRGVKRKAATIAQQQAHKQNTVEDMEDDIPF